MSTCLSINHIGEYMRSEIEQRIKSSISDNEVERLTQDKETIKNLKQKINLIALNIQDDEIEEIAQTIVEKKPNISEIFLSCNHIADKGAVKLARVFSSLNLSFLDLQGNEIGEEGFRALFDLAARQPGLGLALGDNKLIKVGAVEKLKKEAQKKYEKERDLPPAWEEQASHKCQMK